MVPEAGPTPIATLPVAQPVPAPAAGTLTLPVLVFGLVEVHRLKRELEALEDYISQSTIRSPGKQAALPRLSRLLDALATENHMNLLQPETRAVLKRFLEDTEKTAPAVHMSFAVDPSSAFTAKMVTWLRAHIAPNALLQIGLQPTIAAGCIVRTTNKVFDLSLRNRFADADGLLLEALEKANPQPDVPAAAPEAQPAAPAATTAAPPASPPPPAPVAAQPPVAPQAPAAPQAPGAAA